MPETPLSGTPLTVENLVVRYGSDPLSNPVLQHISLAVAPGEFVALLGASGCGKTTLLRAISGFVAVEAGTVSIANRDITRLPPDKRDMAMVFQSYALWPHMSVAQNIGYGLKLRRLQRAAIRQRVDEMLALLGLDGLGSRQITQLSGGQRQRVALGRALAINPRILLLDEPLSNLDARIRQVVRHEIKALQEKLGITTIHVTHDREEAMVMADRIVILNEGRLVQQGVPEEVYNRPASPFVATFMGADNRVSLKISREAGAVRIHAGEHHDETVLPLAAAGNDPGVQLSASTADSMSAYFRSEAARLSSSQELPTNEFTLHGRILQSSYPGGFYRYTVAVGEQQFLVDDEHRRNVGDAVGISVPTAMLYLFPEA